MEGKFNWVDSQYSRMIESLTETNECKIKRIAIYKGQSVGFSQSNVGLVKVMKLYILEATLGSRDLEYYNSVLVCEDSEEKAIDFCRTENYFRGRVFDCKLIGEANENTEKGLIMEDYTNA